MFRVSESQSLFEEKIAFRRHFSSLLGGFTRTFATLVQEDRNVDSKRLETVQPDMLETSLPSEGSLCMMYRAMTPNKGFRESRVCTNVYKAFPEIMASIEFPLVVKSYTRIQPPSNGREGCWLSCSKIKDLPVCVMLIGTCFLLTTPENRLGSSLGGNSFPRLLFVSLDTQFVGGLNGGETAFAHLYVRLTAELCQQVNRSFACLFLDVVAAFAQMLRRIVFDIDQGDEQWLHKLSCSGFSQEDIDFMYHRICSYRFDEQFSNDTSSPGNPLDFKTCEPFFVNGWMSQEYLPNVIQVTRGSSAGTPLDDLTYSLAMSRVLDTFRLALEHCDLLSHVDVSEQRVALHEVSFVDDVAVPIVSTASDIIDKMSRTTECAVRIFTGYGLELIFIASRIPPGQVAQLNSPPNDT